MNNNFQSPPVVDDKAWKKDKLRLIREYHSQLISDLGISELDFNMKKPFTNHSDGRIVVGLFASEFKKDKGFFFEIIDSKLDPVDPARAVYRVPPNANFHDEYELNEKSQYLVPMEELRIVNPQSVAIMKTSAVTSSDRFDEKKEVIAPKTSGNTVFYPDALYSEMTIRDYVAITYKKLVSNKQWLNDLISDKLI